jgi:sugar phosphate isomerase/epimerase
MKSRRNFLKLAGAGAIAAGLAPLAGFSQEVGNNPNYSFRKTDPFKLGIAGYTFYKLSFEKAVEIMKKVNVTNLSLKDNFLPLTSDNETIKKVISRFTASGINVYTVGVIYMAKEEEVNRAFDYAKAAGVSMIVAAPNVDMLPLVEKKAREYDMRVAIHNHGPDNTLFPTATDIWDHIKDMDKRIGICLDIGHTTRAGENPAVDAIRYASRLFDIHIKDVTAATKEGKTIEMGRGIIDIRTFVSAIREIRYKGMCSLEFEKDMDDPTAGVSESIEYLRKVLKG